MAQNIILGADRAPQIPPGHDIDALGPSDTSDTGSDVQGTVIPGEIPQHLDDLHTRHESEDSLRQEIHRADSDTTATGERASAILSENLRDGGDIAPDQIVDTPDGSPLEDDDFEDKDARST